MTKRKLTVRLASDWRAGIRSALSREGLTSRKYQGETLAFETPAVFFGKLTEKRWDLVHALQGKGAMSTRAIAALVGRDVKRVHDDLVTLIELGLLERGEAGVSCPFATIHVDFELKAAA